MPFLTRENLESLTLEIQNYYKGKKRHEREDAYALTYGWENSYHLSCDYHGLFGEGIMPEDVEKGMGGGFWSIREQLEKILAYAENKRPLGDCDVVVFIPQRYCFNDVWQHAAEVDPDARAASEKSKIAMGSAVYHSPETPASNLDSLKALAEIELGNVPKGTEKENFLPFVKAALRYWDARQIQMLNADNTAESFHAANEQISYRESYKRLTGLDWKDETL